MPRDQWAFFLTLTIAIVLLFCVWLIARSRFGRALIAVRDHESAAETVGINLPRVKVTAFALSALYAGTAGSLSILVTRTANAGKVETFQLSIEFLVALVIGGAATVFGPMLGAFIVVFFRDFIDDQDRLSDLLDDPSRAKLLSPAIFGIGLIILMYVLPDGIVGGSRRLIRRIDSPGDPLPKLRKGSDRCDSDRANRFRLFALATVLALVLAACGDGRDDDDDSAGGDDDFHHRDHGRG